MDDIVGTQHDPAVAFDAIAERESTITRELAQFKWCEHDQARIEMLRKNQLLLAQQISDLYKLVVAINNAVAGMEQQH